MYESKNMHLLRQACQILSFSVQEVLKWKDQKTKAHKALILLKWKIPIGEGQSV